MTSWEEKGRQRKKNTGRERERMSRATSEERENGKDIHEE
jgi:hypothetical protein